MFTRQPKSSRSGVGNLYSPPDAKSPETIPPIDLIRLLARAEEAIEELREATEDDHDKLMDRVKNVPALAALLSQILESLDEANSVTKPPSEMIQAEYHRLRRLAHKSGDKRAFWFDQARANRMKPSIWTSCVNKGTYHSEQERTHHKRASDFIFRVHNIWDNPKCRDIDLHGQYPNEVGHILRERVSIARNEGLAELRLVVGKGSHSPSGICMIREKALDFCHYLGLAHRFESGNSGAILINMPPPIFRQLREIAPKSTLDFELNQQREGGDVEVLKYEGTTNTTSRSIETLQKINFEKAAMIARDYSQGATTESQGKSRDNDGFTQRRDDARVSVTSQLYWIDCHVKDRCSIMTTILSSKRLEHPQSRPPRIVIYGPNTIRMQTSHLQLHNKHSYVGFVSQDMSNAERELVVQDFQNDKIRILVSTWWNNKCKGTKSIRLFAQMVFICGLPVRYEYMGPYDTYSDKEGSLPEVVGLFDSKQDEHVKKIWEAGMAGNGYQSTEYDIKEVLN